MTRVGKLIRRKDLPIKRVVHERCPYCGNPTLDFVMNKKGVSRSCPRCQWPETSYEHRGAESNGRHINKKVTIKLTPAKKTSHGRMWMAEATLSNGNRSLWRSPSPMTVGDIIAALSAAGCSQMDINKSLRDTYALYQERFLEEEAEEKFGPTLRAAFSGEFVVPPQEPLVEAEIAYVLYLEKSPRHVFIIADGADFYYRDPPTPDRLAWALLQIRNRGWLLVQGDLYGLTSEGRKRIRRIAGRRGDVWDRTQRLKAWISAHPP